MSFQINNLDMIRFYHDKLPNEEKEIYLIFEEALMADRKECSIPKALFQHIQTDQLPVIFRNVYYDHPILFYVDFSQVKYRSIGTIVKVNWNWWLPDQTIPQMKNELNAAVHEIHNKCFPTGWKGLSDIRKEKELFDYICNNIVYDRNAYEHSDEYYHNNNRWAWTAYAALVNKSAVCEGISLAFKILCESVKIPTVMVFGKAEDEGHAWNIAKISGHFYNVDCTWCLRKKDEIRSPYDRYRYFNIPDSLLHKNRQPAYPYYPRCHRLDSNPFFMKGYVAKDINELKTLWIRELNKKAQRYAFMCIDFSLTEEMIDRIVKELFIQFPKLELVYWLDNDKSYLGVRVDQI